MLLWVCDALQYGVDFDEGVRKFVDCYMTCSSETQDNDLNELVQAVQIHKHSSSCKRCKHCRFNFPKVPSITTCIAKLFHNVKEYTDYQNILKIVKDHFHNTSNTQLLPNKISQLEY